MLLVHILVRLEDVNIATKCKFTSATSFKLSSLKGPCRIQTVTKNHFTPLVQCLSLNLLATKKIAKMKESVKNKTGKSQRVRQLNI